MKTMKYSRQRESIKNFLSTRKDHPTADTVYMNIRKEYPNISLGTVYRNLSLLASMGEIQKRSRWKIWRPWLRKALTVPFPGIPPYFTDAAGNVKKR